PSSRTSAARWRNSRHHNAPRTSALNGKVWTGMPGCTFPVKSFARSMSNEEASRQENPAFSSKPTHQLLCLSYGAGFCGINRACSARSLLGKDTRDRESKARYQSYPAEAGHSPIWGCWDEQNTCDGVSTTP